MISGDNRAKLDATINEVNTILNEPALLTDSYVRELVKDFQERVRVLFTTLDNPESEYSFATVSFFREKADEIRRVLGLLVFEEIDENRIKIITSKQMTEAEIENDSEYQKFLAKHENKTVWLEFKSKQ